MFVYFSFLFFFFFNDPATTEIYTLSLHDALPITPWTWVSSLACGSCSSRPGARSEEHTSELQAPVHLVCRLLLEKKKHTLHPPILYKKKKKKHPHTKQRQ